MEQQHHNYEYGETFGFINAAFGEPENFSHNQEDQASKTNIPAIINDSASPAPTDLKNPHSPYDLSTDSKDPATEISNENKLEENVQSDSNIQSQITEEIAQKEDTNSDVQESIENSDKSIENQEKSTEENATSEQNIEETATRSSENVENEAQKVVGSKQFKRDISGKKRRRIMVLNDDDSEDEEANELKKELLNRSSDVEEDEKKSEKSSEQDADSENDSEDEKEEELATSTNRNFLKAKYLLKTAVIIEDPDKKKKKKKKQRVLDSDDDDQMLTSVDDIGLLGNENENENEEEEEMFTDDIVIINNDPIIPPEDVPEESSTTTEQLEKEKEPELETKEKEEVSEKTEEVKESTSENLDSTDKTDEKPENEEQKSPKDTESSEKPTEKNEEDDVNAELDKIQPMDDNDDFFKFNDTSDEDEQKDVSNDKYFGTPDKNDKKGSNTAIRGRRRAPVTRRNPSGTRSQPKKRGDQYEQDFVDDSESESSYSESMSSSSSESSSSSREKVKKRPPPSRPGPQSVKNAQNLIRNSVTITKVPTKKDMEQKGRFYDKSRNIPNDVYFGDVKVPLHVLHSRWNSDGQSDRVRKVQQHFPQNRPIQRQINTTPMLRMPIPSQNTIPQAARPTIPTFRPQILDDDSKLNVMKEFMKVSGLKINYGKLFHNVKSTAHKCALLRRILVQKGMDGEPTMAKCKKLKLELQAKREIAELDKSVILPVEGRTRRSRRGVASKDSEDSMGPSNNEGESTSNVQPEVLEVLTKIKSVIDSDTD